MNREEYEQHFDEFARIFKGDFTLYREGAVADVINVLSLGMLTLGENATRRDFRHLITAWNICVEDGIYEGHVPFITLEHINDPFYADDVDTGGRLSIHLHTSLSIFDSYTPSEDIRQTLTRGTYEAAYKGGIDDVIATFAAGVPWDDIFTD